MQETKTIDVIAVDDGQVLEASLEFLRPFQEMFNNIQQQARSRGLVVPFRKPLPVKLTPLQLELIANFVGEVEDGLAHGWSKGRHELVFRSVGTVLALKQREQNV